MSEAKLIAGLGNPGKDYEFTRHNLGFLVVEHLARQYHLKFSRHSASESLMATGKIDGQELILQLPLTYVNNSGRAVAAIAARESVALDNILLVCDDLALDFGEVRLKARGSAGGHNGLKSVIEHLKTQEFARLRMGIGAPLKKDETVDFVLSEFDPSEKKELGSFVGSAADGCRLWLTGGITKAMSQLNKRKEDEQV